MSTIRLYDLLPAAHRARDVEQGEPLRALFEVIQEQFDALEDDIRGLYENLFIETCDEWVVPYIGELLGLKPLQPVQSTEFSLRSFVGNTLRYRRRKGTAPVLEQVARDLTGWPCRAVEFFQLLSTTQYARHPRLANHRTPSLRDGDALELVGTPFQRAAHTVEVRRVARERGRYNIPNVGLYLWRLRDWTLERGEALPWTSPADGRYTVDPLGLGVPMFNRSRSEPEILHLATEADVPGRLRRRPLWSELEAIRARGDDAPRVWFDARPPFRVYLAHPDTGAGAWEEEVPVEALGVCDLSDDGVGEWRRPVAPVRVAVDPVLGRVALAAGENVTGVRVTWAYASPGRYAGGPYDRLDAMGAFGVDAFTWRRGVLRDTLAGIRAPGGGAAPDTVATLADAVAAWNAEISSATGPIRGLIVVLDNSTYAGDLEIELRAGSTLVVAAGRWLDDATDPSGRWPLTRLVPDGCRPHVRGDLSVRTSDAGGAEGDRELVLDGLLLDGALTVEEGDLTRLRVSHCTVVPERGGVAILGGPGGKNASLQLEIDRSWIGVLTVAADAAQAVSVADSIVDGGVGAFAGGTQPEGAMTGLAIEAPTSALAIRRSTVFGATDVRSVEASDCVFTDALVADRRQVGCVRYSYVPWATSRTPRRFRCQPDLALDALAETEGWEHRSAADQNAEQARVLAQVRPVFDSTTFGEPGYGMLDVRCPAGIRSGSENGSEMGAFCALDLPLREANLRASLDEFLPFGLEAGIFFVT